MLINNSSFNISANTYPKERKGKNSEEYIQSAGMKALATGMGSMATGTGIHSHKLTEFKYCACNHLPIFVFFFFSFGELFVYVFRLPLTNQMKNEKIQNEKLPYFVFCSYYFAFVLTKFQFSPWDINKRTKRLKNNLIDLFYVVLQF